MELSMAHDYSYFFGRIVDQMTHRKEMNLSFPYVCICTQEYAVTYPLTEKDETEQAEVIYDCLKHERKQGVYPFAFFVVKVVLINGQRNLCFFICYTSGSMASFKIDWHPETGYSFDRLSERKMFQEFMPFVGLHAQFSKRKKIH